MTSLSGSTSRQDAGPPRSLACAVVGLSAGWIQTHLDPLLHAYQDNLHRVELDASQFEGSEDPHEDWDILLLGAEAEPRPSGTLEAAVRRLAMQRPMECIIAIMPAASPDRAAELMRAGALDAIAAEGERDALERAFDHAIGTLQARRAQTDRDKLRIVSQLAISVNHEINNPLAGLMGTAELMRRDNKSLDEKGRRDLQVIITQCQRIQEVTSRLKHLNHLRTVPYGAHDSMIDLIGELSPSLLQRPTQHNEQFFEVPSLLVVDDNPLIVDLISRVFEGRFEIDAAACASDALSQLEQHDYDVVLIDLILPEMNGLELYRAIRRMRPKQRALLTTAYHGDARVGQAIAEGALGCIYKPFQLEELEEKLDAALKK